MPVDVDDAGVVWACGRVGEWWERKHAPERIRSLGTAGAMASGRGSVSRDGGQGVRSVGVGEGRAGRGQKAGDGWRAENAIARQRRTGIMDYGGGGGGGGGGRAGTSVRRASESLHSMKRESQQESERARTRERGGGERRRRASEEVRKSEAMMGVGKGEDSTTAQRQDENWRRGCRPWLGAVQWQRGGKLRRRMG